MTRSEELRKFRETNLINYIKANGVSYDNLISKDENIRTKAFMVPFPASYTVSKADFAPYYVKAVNESTFTLTFGGTSLIS